VSRHVNNGLRSTEVAGTLRGMRRGSATKVLVPGGLALALLANLWIETPPAGAPGIAFGSETILVVERSVALFAAWMLALVVLIESWRGQLPLEISSRGVRYADAAATHTSVDTASKALTDLQAQLDWQAYLIEDLQKCYGANTRK
jgi:hypothetical protein